MSALGSLSRHRTFFIVGAFAMALSVGADLVVFAYANALWFRPRPVANPDRVIVIGRDFDTPDGSRYSESALEDLRRNPAFEAVAGQVVTSGSFAGTQPRVTLIDVGSPVETLWVTPDYFAVLGVRVTGREFGPGDGQTGAPAPAIIGDRLWHNTLHARADVLGLVLSAEPLPIQVVGVAPAGFTGARLGEHADLWLPHRLLPRLSGQQTVDPRNVILPMTALARLRPGASIDDARSWFAAGPRAAPELTTLKHVFGAADLPMVLVPPGRQMVMAALAAIFVLIAGCATLTALGFVYYERRRGELAVRLALGAGRPRLIRTLACELSVLWTAGAVGALMVASWTLAVLPRFTLPGGLDLARVDATLDWRVALVGGLACAGALAAAAALPISRFTSTDMTKELVGAAHTGQASSTRMLRAILTVHVAAAVVTLVAAGLFVQTVWRAVTAGAGFDESHVLFATAQTRNPFAPRDGRAAAARAVRDVAATRSLVDELTALPGVEAVAAGASPIGLDREHELSLLVPVEAGAARQQLAFGLLVVDSGYLDALGVRLLAGRPGGRHEAIVTPAFADAVWPGESPIGRRFTVAGDLPATVAGVADFPYGSIRLDQPPAVLYVGDRDVTDGLQPTGALALTIRAREPEAIRAAAERLLRRAFPDAPVVTVVTGRDVVDRDIGRERMNAWIFSGFGLTGFVLAVGSVFGLVAYVAETRRREFGVMVALGATPGMLLRQAVRTGLEPAVLGAAIGLVAALALARSIETYLIGTSGVDVPTYAGVSLTLVACVALASALAAMRVRRVAPMDALRTE